MNRLPIANRLTVTMLLLCFSALVVQGQSSAPGAGQGSLSDTGQKAGQSPERGAVQKPDPCAAITTMADFNICYAEEFKKEDMNLNHLYRAALVVLEHELDDALKRSAKDEAGYANNAIDDLKSAQAAWVKYRDLQCRAAGQQYQGGSIQPLVVNQCLTLVTEHRIEEIKEAYEIGGRKLE
jgi:uncharacterized protein YecT (DUF1311 family)